MTTKSKKYLSFVKWGVLLMFFVGVLLILFEFTVSKKLKGIYLKSPELQRMLSTHYEESCLSSAAESLPMWECYEFELDTQTPVYSKITAKHGSGLTLHSRSFIDKSRAKVRFTFAHHGKWCIENLFPTNKDTLNNEKNCITIDAFHPEYAQGFVSANKQKWIRTASQQAFLPQFIMYDRPDLDRGIEEFIHGHGFTGFHITNLRDFLKNPGYFEAVILKTYRAGGTTHFWLWGDEDRQQTPSTYGIDVQRLYSEIAARLSPLPAWTLGYGFDLHEWTEEGEIQQLRDFLNTQSSFTHMIGARGHKNSYDEVEKNLDFASWEWHRPSFEDYREHIKKADNRPAFSEDRFRIRDSIKHAQKDYNETMTRQGLWRSLFSGGIANIWGHTVKRQDYSLPYQNKNQIRFYKYFVDAYFSMEFKPAEAIIPGFFCAELNTEQEWACYGEDKNPFLPEETKEKYAVSILMDTIKTETHSTLASIDIQEEKKSDWVLILRKILPGQR